MIAHAIKGQDIKEEVQTLGKRTNVIEIYIIDSFSL